MSKQRTLPINRRALVARLTRALSKQGRILRADRRGRGCIWMLIDGAKIVRIDVDLAELARELAVLQPWERLER